MHVVHFWGQGRGLLVKQECATLSHFAHIQTEGAAYLTFYLCPSVPVRHTNLYLHVCFKSPPY